MKRSAHWIVCGWLAACGSSEEPRRPDASAATRPPRPAEPAEPRGPLLESPARMFLGKSPTLPEALASVSFGMTRQVVATRAPKLADGEGLSRRYSKVRYIVQFDDEGPEGRLERIRILFEGPAFDLVGALTDAWGRPVSGRDVAEDTALWFNPDSGVRASVVLGRAELVLDGYIPAGQLLGEPDEPLGFAKHPLLGARKSEVDRSYGSPIPLAAIEYSLGPTVVETQVRNEVVVGVTFRLGFARRAAAREELLELMRAKWGQGRQVGEAPVQMAFGRNVRVVEDTIERAWIVSVQET